MGFALVALIEFKKGDYLGFLHGELLIVEQLNLLVRDMNHAFWLSKKGGNQHYILDSGRDSTSVGFGLHFANSLSYPGVAATQTGRNSCAYVDSSMCGRALSTIMPGTEIYMDYIYRQLPPLT